MNKTNFLKLIIATLFVIIIVGPKVKICAASSDKIEVTSLTSGKVIFRNTGGYLSKEVVAIDKKNGIATIELKFDNSEEAEIMAVIDNSTHIGDVQGKKDIIVNSLTALSNNLFDNVQNVKLGIMQVHTNAVTTTTPVNNGLINDFVGTKSEAATALAAYSNTPTADGNDFETVMTNAQNSFSDSAVEKIIVLIIDDYNDANYANYYTVLHNNNWDSSIKLFTIFIGEEADDNLFNAQSITLQETLNHITLENLSASLPTNFISYLSSKLPTPKTNVVVTDYFTTNILNAFNVVYGPNPNLGSIGNFDSQTKSFVWTIGNLGINQIASFRYNIELKNYDIPDSLINVPINSNVKVNINFLSTGGVTTGTGDYECSPSFKILQNAVSNPKTGVMDIILPSMIFGCATLLTYVYIKKKDKIKTL